MRRIDFYTVKNGENLGDPETWNKRLEDIDLRIAKNEDAAQIVEETASRVESAALARVDNVITPLVVEAITRLQSVANIFEAQSTTEVTIGTGAKQFEILEGQRNTFTALSYLVIFPSGDLSKYMVARKVSFTKSTGVLIVDVLRVEGAGTSAAWTIAPMAFVGDLEELLVEAQGVAEDIAADAAAVAADRATVAADKGTVAADKATVAADKATVASDKSFAVIAMTSAQAAQAAAEAARDEAEAIVDLDASSISVDPAGGITATNVQAALVQLDTLKPTNDWVTTSINNALTSLVNGAPGALNTLKELSDALGGDANFSASVATALGNRLRVDTNAQGLDGTQKGNARTNLGLGAAAILDAATAAEIRAKTSTKLIPVDKAWEAAGWVNLGGKTGSFTIDCNTGSKFYFTATGNVTITLSNETPGQDIMVAMLQDATGGRTVSWADNVLWPDGIVPAVGTTAGAWGLIACLATTSATDWFFGTGWKTT